MLSDCAPCREAGRICRTHPVLAKQLHEKCAFGTGCLCLHIIPEDGYEYPTSREDC